MADPLLRALVRALDLVVAERMPDGSFVAVAPPPSWLAAQAVDGQRLRLREALPFLEGFLGEAEAFWWREQDGVCESGPFAPEASGEELLLSARAVTAGRYKLLVLERLTGLTDTRPLIQKAREAMLEHERLVRRVESLRKPAAALTRLGQQLLETELTPAQRDLAAGIERAAAQVQAVTGTPQGPGPART